MRRDLLWLLVLLPLLALATRAGSSVAAADGAFAALAREVFGGLGPVDVQVLDHPRMRWHYRVHLCAAGDVDEAVRALVQRHHSDFERAVWPRGAVIELSTPTRRLPDVRILQDEAWGGVGAHDAVVRMERALDARLGAGNAFVLFVPGHEVSVIANVGTSHLGRADVEADLRPLVPTGLPVRVGLVDDWAGRPAWK